MSAAAKPTGRTLVKRALLSTRLVAVPSRFFGFSPANAGRGRVRHAGIRFYVFLSAATRPESPLVARADIERRLRQRYNAVQTSGVTPADVEKRGRAFVCFGGTFRARYVPTFPSSPSFSILVVLSLVSLSLVSRRLVFSLACIIVDLLSLPFLLYISLKCCHTRWNPTPRLHGDTPPAPVKLRARIRDDRPDLII